MLGKLTLECNAFQDPDQCQNVKVVRVEKWTNLTNLQEKWEELLLDSDSSSIFSTSEWLGAWWGAFGRGKEIIGLVFLGPSEELVGLMLLYVDFMKAPLTGRLRRLRFVGDGTHDSDNLDMIVRRGYERSCADVLMDWLSVETNWDVCELNTLPANSIMLPHIISVLADRQWEYRTLNTGCSSIPLPNSWERYLSLISRKERTKINYYTRRLERKFRVSFTKCTQEDALPSALETLFELHQQRWNQRGLPGSFASAERRIFYYDMAASFLRLGWLELWVMSLDGKPVASQFAFRYRETVYVLQEGFDPKFKADSVGYVLRAYVLRTLISEGTRRYDFLGGNSASKVRWGAQLGNYVNLHLAKPASAGAFFLEVDQASRAAKARLKADLPPYLWKIMKDAYCVVHRSLDGTLNNKEFFGIRHAKTRN